METAEAFKCPPEMIQKLAYVSLASLEPKKVSYKRDMIFCKVTYNHDKRLEFKATGASKDYNGDETTKILAERFTKLLECLKDILDNLAVEDQTMNNIETDGFIYSGL
ncbi:unnamed protein product [Rhizopus stolonifer]